MSREQSPQRALPEFVEFLFNRPELRSNWNGAIDGAAFPPHSVAVLYSELFKNSISLKDTYNRHQLESGFWAIQSTNLPISAANIIWDSSIPLVARQECVRSMYLLFRDLFSTIELETSVNMWWDCMQCNPVLKRRSSVDDVKAIEQTIFETLCQILQLDSAECQGAALHGLGHLKHPSKEKAIRDFMGAHPELTDDEVDYCEGCISGEIM